MNTNSLLFRPRSERFAQVMLTAGTKIFVLDDQGDVWEYETECWPEWLKFDCEFTDVAAMLEFLPLHRPNPWQISWHDFAEELECGVLLLGLHGDPNHLLYVEPVQPRYAPPAAMLAEFPPYARNYAEVSR